MHQTTKQHMAVVPDFTITTLLGDAILPQSQRPSPYQFGDIYT